MRWIGLHLPWLSLESFASTLNGPLEARPLALVDVHHVVGANLAAQSLGVKAGLKRATALALVPDLVLGQADARRDTQALLSVAHAALAFTPMVCVCPPDGLLLEVQPSLRYFGGREALLTRLRAATAPLGHRLQLADAPTAHGAHWLAKLRDGLHCADAAALQRALDASPLWLLAGAEVHGEVWQSMGLQRLGALRRLPRSGLARRFGESLLAEIDCAYGTRPDPREPLVLPATFHSHLELFARADTTEQVLHGAQVLLERLVAWLSAQHAFVRRFVLRMKHEARWRHDDRTPPCTTLDVALAEPSRDAAHLLVLLRERLAALQLPAPTLELELHASDIARRAPPNDELFPTQKGEREGLVRLVERLQARLGHAQVQRLVPVADHRPERSTRVQPVEAASLVAVEATSAPRGGPLPAAGRAWGSAPVGSTAPRASTAKAVSPTSPTSSAPKSMSKSARRPSAPKPGPDPAATPTPDPAAPYQPPRLSADGALHRPVWLLPHPVALHEGAAGPLLDGRALRLLAGPERIESGWWDADLVERDYFVAQTPDQALVWLFRTRLPLSAECGPGWFLQGLFG